MVWKRGLWTNISTSVRLNRRDTVPNMMSSFEPTGFRGHVNTAVCMTKRQGKTSVHWEKPRQIVVSKETYIELYQTYCSFYDSSVKKKKKDKLDISYEHSQLVCNLSLHFLPVPK